MKKKLPKELQPFPLLPRYGGASLVEIPATILSHFGVANARPVLASESHYPQTMGAEKIILFFVDGLGYDHVVRAIARKNRLFELFAERGNISPITTVFPTTTAAGLTSIHSGLSPQEHGLPEWTLYFEELDMVVETIPFRPYKSKEADQLLKMGGTPAMLYNGPTIYEKLRHAGIPSFVFAQKVYADSAFSRSTFRGSSVVEYARGSDLIAKIREHLKSPGSGYFFVYWDQVDATEHEFGPESEEHLSEMAMFSHLVMNEFLGKIRMARKEVEKISILLTADHGQIAVHPDNVTYLEGYAPIGEYLLKKKNGEVIMPTGSARDMFLFVDPSKRRELIERLREKMSRVAEVLATEDAIEHGLFGIGVPTQRFLDRIGNVTILPREKNLLWHREYRKDPLKLKGIHGGLTTEELLIPFCAARLSDLLA